MLLDGGCVETFTEGWCPYLGLLDSSQDVSRWHIALASHGCWDGPDVMFLGLHEQGRRGRRSYHTSCPHWAIRLEQNGWTITLAHVFIGVAEGV